jgi:hypothetical protein
MFDVNDWIDRLVRAGGKIVVDGHTICPSGPVSSEAEAIWNEIRPPVDPEQTRWNVVEAEIRRRTGDVGLGWTIYPDDPRK